MIDFDDVNWDAIEAQALADSAEKKPQPVPVSLAPLDFEEVDWDALEAKAFADHENVRRASLPAEPNSQSVAHFADHENVRRTPLTAENSQSHAVAPLADQNARAPKRLHEKIEPNTSGAWQSQSSLFNEQALVACANKHMGFSELRKGQCEVIRNVLEKRDTVVLWVSSLNETHCMHIILFYMHNIFYAQPY